MRYSYRIMSHQTTEPSITVCIVSRKGERYLADTIRSVNRVLTPRRWALVVLVYGNHDDAGGLAKREMTSAYRMAVYQFPDSDYRSEHVRQAAQIARFLWHECEFYTVLGSGDIMLPGFATMLRFARQENHAITLGLASTTTNHLGGLDRWPFTHKGPALPLAAFVAVAGLPAPQLGSHFDTDFWVTMHQNGIAPGGFTQELVLHVMNDARGTWFNDEPTADVAWVNAKGKLLATAPGCLAIMACGEKALAEARIAAKSCRNACDDSIPIIIVTEPANFEAVASWGMDLVETWDDRPFRRISDAAMEFYAGPDHLRNLFRSVLCRPAIAAEAVARHQSCVMADSDILFTRPFWALPGVPAAAPKSFPWQMCGSYTEMHQWGIISAGVMSFPAGSHAFIAAWQEETIRNAAIYRHGRSTTSAPGGSAFCEQDAWDMAGHVFPVDCLNPGHNFTPSGLGDYCPILAEFGGRGPQMIAALERFPGIAVHEGIWWNGWPVRSLHCHWGGNQMWNGLFEEAMIDCLEASGCSELVKLLAPNETNPGSRAA